MTKLNRPKMTFDSNKALLAKTKLNYTILPREEIQLGLYFS